MGKFLSFYNKRINGIIYTFIHAGFLVQLSAIDLKFPSHLFYFYWLQTFVLF